MKFIRWIKNYRILLAGVQGFAEKGYTDATISEIASLANVADGSVYEYFKNKEDLLLSIAEEHFQNHLHQGKYPTPKGPALI